MAVEMAFLKGLLMTYYIVWNEAKTEGFVTTDKQLAYEVRKSASENCYDQNGKLSNVAVAFCDEWFEDNCIIEVIEKCTWIELS